MKGKKLSTAFLTILVLVSTVLTIISITVHAKATTTPFTGMVPFPPELLNPGMTTFPGGNIHVRGLTLEFYDDFSDDRVKGFNAIVSNWNWNSDGYGPGWGTYSITSEVYPDGSWEGTWVGEFKSDGSVVLNCVGHGMGYFEGLIAKWTYDSYRNPHVIGYILDPRGG